MREKNAENDAASYEEKQQLNDYRTENREQNMKRGKTTERSVEDQNVVRLVIEERS